MANDLYVEVLSQDGKWMRILESARSTRSDDVRKVMRGFIDGPWSEFVAEVSTLTNPVHVTQYRSYLNSEIYPLAKTFGLPIPFTVIGGFTMPKIPDFLDDAIPLMTTINPAMGLGLTTALAVSDLISRARDGDTDAIATVRKVQSAAASGNPKAQVKHREMTAIAKAQDSKKRLKKKRSWLGGLISVGHEPYEFVGMDWRESALPRQDPATKRWEGATVWSQRTKNPIAQYREAVRRAIGIANRKEAGPPSGGAAPLGTAPRSGPRNSSPRSNSPRPGMVWNPAGYWERPRQTRPTVPGQEAWGQNQENWGNPWGNPNWGNLNWGSPNWGSPNNWSPNWSPQQWEEPVIDYGSSNQIYDPATDSFFSNSQEMVYDPDTDSFAPRQNINPYA